VEIAFLRELVEHHRQASLFQPRRQVAHRARDGHRFRGGS
jgi:hypothetical protein